QFSVLELKFYTRYEEYIDDVRREDPEKYQKYRMWFNYFDTHARSYHNLFNDGVHYYNSDSWEIVEHRREFYELDFEFRDGGEHPHLNIRTGRSRIHVSLVDTGEMVKSFIASDGTSRGTDVFRLFSTIESKKHFQMLVISGHTTWIHRLNPKAHNAEMRLGTLIFRLLAA
ncbi:26712_t:CDS:2, partial [Dentiscutata erythropus]